MTKSWYSYKALNSMRCKKIDKRWEDQSKIREARAKERESGGDYVKWEVNRKRKLLCKNCHDRVEINSYTQRLNTKTGGNLLTARCPKCNGRITNKRVKEDPLHQREQPKNNEV